MTPAHQQPDQSLVNDCPDRWQRLACLESWPFGDIARIQVREQM